MVSSKVNSVQATIDEEKRVTEKNGFCPPQFLFFGCLDFYFTAFKFKEH